MDRSVKSATRVFALLEAFEKSRRPLRAADIVAMLDIPQSSASMLLKTLVSEGYMDFNPDTREYAPSLRIAYLCDWLTELPERPDALPAALRSLTARTGESVLLGRIAGLQMQYVAVHGKHPDAEIAPVAGTRRPLHRSALGIVLLSALEDDEARAMLLRYNASVAAHVAPANIEATMRAVAEARDTGFYHSPGFTALGIGVIAILLPSPIRGERLALGIGAPLDRLQRNARMYLDLMNEAAARC